MAIKPILFNTEMVRAIREGRKTETRRVIPIKQIEDVLSSPCRLSNPDIPDCNFIEILCNLRYQKDDVLWVRETWCDPTPDQSGWPLLYKADMPMHWDAEDTEHGQEVNLREEDYHWRPSIHMPRETARIFLHVTDVWAERLQDITEKAAQAEGLYHGPMILGSTLMCEARTGFILLWDHTIDRKKIDLYGWDANPWVQVVQFERCEKPKEF